MERGGREKTGDKQQGGGRNEGEIKEPQQQMRGKRNPPWWKMQKQIKGETTVVFYKRFIMLRKKKRSVFLPKIWSWVFSPKNDLNWATPRRIYILICVRLFLK